MNINIKLETFEGPMDLLYHLIEKNKLDIKDIPIAEVTEQYMNYIANIDELDMDNVSEFMLMAATLLKIKSKMLLPKAKDEIVEEDPREELVQRLLEYKKYKEASENLITREEYSRILYKVKNEIEKYVTMKKIHAEDVLVDITLDDITEAFKRILKANDMKIDNRRSEFKSIKKDLYTIEQKIDAIIERLKKVEKLRFEELFEDDAEKNEKVVTFLALLELIKLRKVTIKQDRMFGVLEVGGVR
ncbi:MAG: hypothetical protein A2Y24_00875 [Clostridiales bacterium GWE2_32_10]|nr:MAG: hypothetical protein A2Y24_00875 [Clostridiales bacterium GWE2_32_10]HBY21342.1 segregation/condensation protein A [Clostridiales bacterium]